MAKGYELEGDVRSGLKATIPFIMPWESAFVFIGQLLPVPTTAVGNAVNWTPPYQFPIVINGQIRPLYAQSWRCVPCGINGEPAEYLGLAPGDYFSTAIVTVGFDSATYLNQATDDPANKNQLDPDNPITACEQSVDVTGKVVTRKGAGYTFDSNSKPVPGDLPIVLNEAKLVLKFPRIPTLPWQLVQPFVGKINSADVLNCVMGSLLLEGMTTIITPAPDGSIAQNLGLKFAFNPDPTGATAGGMDWNSFPLPDGSGYSLITSVSGGKRPYTYVDFRQIFQGLDLGGA
jgi:hypothetical protein